MVGIVFQNTTFVCFLFVFAGGLASCLQISLLRRSFGQDFLGDLSS